MKNKSLLGSISIKLGILVLILFFGLSILKVDSKETMNKATFWKVQSIDTMKYSRDVAREKLKDPAFDLVIYQQVKDIAGTGATHVAIATPYDEEFIPILKRWVSAARTNNLKVWYRGNFSGWERWFGYAGISRDEHKAALEKFIISHPELFEDGDVFTACPECENGGPGDPRQTGDTQGFRDFLIEEHKIMERSFAKIGKDVEFGYNSMNGDVAELIMDRPTTKALGGVVAIDHYVPSGEQTSFDITEIAKNSGGKVYLGEFGAPIPDVHGNLNETEQAEWLDKSLRILTENDNLIGINYWVGRGGSTRLWNDDGTPRAAVESVKKIFSPLNAEGEIKDMYNRPVKNAEISTPRYSTKSDGKGRFALAYLDSNEVVTIKADGYKTAQIAMSHLITNDTVKLQDINFDPNSFRDKVFRFIFEFNLKALFGK